MECLQSLLGDPLLLQEIGIITSLIQLYRFPVMSYACVEKNRIIRFATLISLRVIPLLALENAVN